MNTCRHAYLSYRDGDGRWTAADTCAFCLTERGSWVDRIRKIDWDAVGSGLLFALMPIAAFVLLWVAFLSRIR